MDAQMALEDPREPIFEIDRKYRFLLENKISQGCCGHTASKASFARNLGIPRTTLDASLEARRLTSGQQNALAKKCRFSVDWPEWNDRKATSNTKRENRLDTGEAFINRYLAEHSCEQEPKSSPLPVVPVLLKEDLRADANSTQTELASLSLWTGQSEPAPGEAKLGFNLNCPEVVTDGLTTGVKRGVLTFRCGDGHTTEVKDRTGYPGGVEFNDAKFTPLSVNKNEPSWLVTAIGAVAIGLIGDAPQDFIRIMNLRPGGSVCADFIACVRDIATAFVLPNGHDQSAAKQKIKKRLRERKLSGGEEGIAKLAVAEIKFTERGQ
jgi:hypothetical protein